MEEGAPSWAGLSPCRGSVWGPRGTIWVPHEAGFSEGQPGGADAACCEEEPGRSVCLCAFLCTHTCFTKDSQTPKCQTQFSRQVTTRRESGEAMRAWYSWPSGEGVVTPWRRRDGIFQSLSPQKKTGCWPASAPTNPVQHSHVP